MEVIDNESIFRKVKGVIQIEIDDETATVHIFAETADAAKKARQVSLRRKTSRVKLGKFLTSISRFWSSQKTTTWSHKN